MDKALQRLTAWVLLAGLILLAAACGGGGTGGSGGGGTAVEETTSITGIAMKGPIKGAWVGVYELKSDGNSGELLGSGTSGNDGRYDVKIPKKRANGPLIVVVKGQAGAKYYSEILKRDVDFSDKESFHAIMTAADVSQDVTVGPLTEAAYQKLQQLTTATPDLKVDTSVVNRVNQQIAALFNVTSLLGNPATDPAYLAALTVIDQMIVSSTTPDTPSDTRAVMSLINQALSAPVLDAAAPSYKAFQQALLAAATTVAAADPTLSAAVAALKNSVSNPPDWTDFTAPTAPSNLLATTARLTASTSSVSLSWTPSTDNIAVTGYDVYRDSIKIATVTAAKYTDLDLANNATYSYYIIAFDRAGNRSVASNIVPVPVEVPVNDTTAPTAPSKLSAATFLIDTTTASFVLTWTASTDNKAVTGYDIYRDGTKIGTVATPGYTDTPVVAGTTYTYYIIAFDGAGNRSVESDHISATPNRPSLGVIVNGRLSPNILGLSENVPPTAPSNLSASTFALTANMSSVILSWNPSTDNTAVTGYEIYRDNIRIATVASPGYSDPTVTSSKTYIYYVIAFDAAGNRSIASNQLSVTPNVPSFGVTVNGQLSSGVIGQPQLDISAPTAPSNLTASTVSISASQSSVLLAWSPSTDNKAVTGYEIYRDNVRIATVALLGYADPSVSSTTKYTYFIVAFDAAGNRSIASNYLAVTPNQVSLGVTVSGQLSSGVTGLPTIPSAPSNLTASTSSISATQSSVLLAWSPSSGKSAITGYEIFRNGVKIATVALLGYTDSPLDSAVTYSYYVIAIDAAGTRSAMSSQLSVTPNQASLGVTVSGQLSSGVIGQIQVDISAPTAPSNLSASTSSTSTTESSVLLAWSSSSDNTAVTGYEVYRNGSKIATVAGTGYFDAKLMSATTYTYYVIAVDAAGNRSPVSNQLSVTPNQASLGVTVGGQLSSGVIGQQPLDVSAPTAPTNVTASTFSTSTTSSSVMLAWSPSSDNTAVTGYEVYRNGIMIATVSLLGYTDPSVTSSSTYTYYIKSFDAVGNRSVSSNLLTVTPNVASLGVSVSGQLSSGVSGQPYQDITEPTTPTNLTASTIAISASTSAVLLAWSPSSDNNAVIGYEIYRNGTKIASASHLGYTDQPVASNTTNVYYIVAVDAAGNRSAASNQLAVTPNVASLGVTINGQLSSGVIGQPQQDISSPTAPTNLSASTIATSATSSSVLLAWSPASDNMAVTGYEIYRNGSKLATVTAALVYTDPSVSSSVSYSYYVIAFDAAGNRSGSSNVLAVTPNVASLGVTINGQLSTGVIGQPQQDITAPTAPTNLAASTFATSATTSSVLLAWSPASDNIAVTGYEIYRNGIKVATVSSTSVYIDPTVTSSVSYSYYVVAFDAAGNRSGSSNVLAVTPNTASLGVTINGQLSSGVIGQPQQDITSPTSPTNLTASTFVTSATTSSVLLAWSASSDNTAVTGYDIYRNGSKLATVTAALVYTDPTVTSTVSYTYYVVAVDAAGNRSGSSNLLVVTPNVASFGVTINGQLSTGVIVQPQQDITAPTSPTNLTATASLISVTTSSVTLTWNQSTDNVMVTGYDIYRNGSKIGTVSSLSLAYTDPSVTTNVAYNYYIVAVDAVGNRSAASNLLTVTPAAASLGVSFSGQISSLILGL